METSDLTKLHSDCLLSNLVILFSAEKDLANSSVVAGSLRGKVFGINDCFTVWLRVMEHIYPGWIEHAENLAEMSLTKLTCLMADKSSLAIIARFVAAIEQSATYAEIDPKKILMAGDFGIVQTSDGFSFGIVDSSGQFAVAAGTKDVIVTRKFFRMFRCLS